MKTEQEVVAMLKQVSDQGLSLYKGHPARRRLNDRVIALMWVLAMKEAPGTLCFPQSAIDLIEGIW
jgi:hypothetical protein